LTPQVPNPNWELFVPPAVNKEVANRSSASKTAGSISISKSESHTQRIEPNRRAPRPLERETLDLHSTAILLDIDGTLLDLAATPAGVLVPSNLQSTLTTLWKWTGGALALVSGRPLKDIDRIFAPLELPAVGGHGAEIRATAKTPQKKRLQPLLLDERVRRQLLGLARKGIIIEDKGYSMALHYRLAPELGPELRRQVALIASSFSDAHYEVLPGKFVIEVKPTAFNKGTAVLQLMELPPFAGRRPLFIGDDVTDEAVFAILPDVHGTGFSVGRLIAGATGVFGTPADVRAWLGRMAAKADEQ
jgi:trehalose 6-phosphate phosphatase